MTSRLEINVCRLLSCCEKMVSDKSAGNWRLRKYIEDLDEKMAQLEKELRKPSPDVFKEYVKRVDLLKKVLNAERLVSAADNVKVIQTLKPGTIFNSGASSPHTRDTYIKARSVLSSEMRSELLDGQNGLGPSSTTTNDVSNDIDAVLQHQRHLQEKLAEEMVFLAKNMKEHAVASSKIVQEDNRRLAEAEKLAGDNSDKLRVEAHRLEGHVQKAYNWWIWIALALVLIVFVCMILFMRLFPKLR